jgi:hypothetical protein
MRAFLGFTYYYSSYIHMYAELVAAPQEKVKVPGHIGKKESRFKAYFNPRILNFLRKKEEVV